MLICTKCNKEYEHGKFCKVCGGALHEKKAGVICSACGTKLNATPQNCPRCGAELPSGAKFCHQCGAKIQDFVNAVLINEGRNVEGTVVGVTDDTVYVWIDGLPREGELRLSEFSGENPELGSKITVYLSKSSGRHGLPVISKQKADETRLWDEFQLAFKEKTPVSGTITSVQKGGYNVDLGGGISAFLPISQADSQKVEKEEKLVGLKAQFYIERLYSSNKKRNVVVNRRKYLDQDNSDDSIDGIKNW